MFRLGGVDADIAHPFMPSLELHLNGIPIDDLRDATRQGLGGRG
jgi:hypothetical protein